MTRARGPYQAQLEQVPATPRDSLREHIHDVLLVTWPASGKEKPWHPVVQLVPGAADEPEDALSRVSPVFFAEDQGCQRHELAVLLGDQEGQRPSEAGLVVRPCPFHPPKLVEEPCVAGRQHHCVIAWAQRTQLVDRGHPACLNGHRRRLARNVRPRTASSRIQ
jgi:hypothetical protein